MALLEILGFFLSPFVNLLEPYVRQISDVLTSRTLHRKFVQGLIALSVFILLVGVAFAAYLGFYWVYIPQRGHSAPVHLQYGFPTPLGAAISSKSPTALVDFTRGGRLDQILRGDQAYDISVNLIMPTSERNVAVGNFMVTVSLLDRQDRILTTSSRPAILTYESLLLRLMRTIWRAVPLILRWSKESQTIKVMVLEKFKEDSQNPVVRALVKVSNAELQIYKCSIHIDAHFQGLRYFMYYYRISTAIVFMSLFIFWEIVFTILTWQGLSGWFGIKEEDEDSMALVTRHGQHPPQGQHQQPQHGRDTLRSPTSYPAIASFSTRSTMQSRSQLLIPSLGPTPRQPQFQEDPYLALESQGSDDGEDDEGEDNDLLHHRALARRDCLRGVSERRVLEHRRHLENDDREVSSVPVRGHGDGGGTAEGEPSTIRERDSAGQGGEDQQSFSSGHLVSEDDIESIDDEDEQDEDNGGSGVRVVATAEADLLQGQGVDAGTPMMGMIRARRRPTVASSSSENLV